MAGRPLGATTKHKPFRAALNRAIDEGGSDPEAMDEIARVLIAAAKGGDIQAIRELGDRLDGKPAQAVIGGDDDEPAVKVDAVIRRIIVEPNGHQDGESVSPAPAASEI